MIKPLQKLVTHLRTSFTSTHSCHGVRLRHRDPRLNKVMRRLICNGRYESSERAALENLLSSDDRVLELGGCVGYLAAYAAQRCGSEHVTTVEANPEILSLIRENHSLNDVAPKVVHGVAALSDGEPVRFQIAENICCSGTSSDERARQIDVPTVDVNRLIGELTPTFLIIDVEGAEQELIARLNLQSVQKILIEVHPDKTGPSGASDVISTLIDRGFCIDFDNTDGLIYAMVRPTATVRRDATVFSDAMRRPAA